MKIFFNIMSILIVALVLFFLSLNSQMAFNVTFWGTEESPLVIYHATLIEIVVVVFVLGTLAGIFWEAPFWLNAQKKLKEYQRKLEKTSVQSGEDSSRVAILEAKIQTLEKALQSALENKD